MYKSKYVHIIIIMILILYNIIRKCILTLYSSTQTHFYELLVVMCCISLNKQIFLTLLNFKIFIIKIQKDLLFIFLVFHADFVTVYHVKAVQDDLSAKTVPIWLHHTVYKTIKRVQLIVTLKKKLEKNIFKNFL